MMERMSHVVQGVGWLGIGLPRENIIEPTAGTIYIEARNVLEQDPIALRRRIGYAIQHVGLLPHMTVAQNIAVDRRLNLGGTMICFNALQAGDLDLYAEYTGTGLVNILKQPVIADPDEAYRAVKQAFAERHGIVWLEPFGFNNTYTLTMRKAQAKRLGIETISDLAAHIHGFPAGPSGGRQSRRP